MTQMCCANRRSAWLCLVSLYVVGCYTPTVIRPALEDKNVVFWKISQGDITSVVTTDGIEYLFQPPPAVDEDSIVGEAKVRVTEGLLATRASIPLSDVSEISVKEINATLTTISIVFGVLMLAGIAVRGVGVM